MNSWIKLVRAKFCEVIASMWKECYTDIYEVMKVWISQQQWQQSIILIW